ncbi:MAG: PaaI family thioesterase [Alphaproteobacteria bacterium]|nr:PaaI family thioesterase [Alphaproteobacteria bacterium]
MTDHPEPTDLRGSASPLHELLGFRMTEWRDGHCVIVCDLAERHMNRNHSAHGGVLMALLDEAAASAGVWTEGGIARRSVTVDLTTSFIGRAQHGRLTATGTRIGGGQQIYFCRSEVRDEAGHLVAAAASTHRLRAME